MIARVTNKDIELLEASGWDVECQSPAEIRNRETNCFVAGFYAIEIILDSLRKDKTRLIELELEIESPESKGLAKLSVATGRNEDEIVKESLRVYLAASKDGG